MARVTYSNLFTESRKNLVSLISDKSNVSDPVTSSSESRKWIYSREPDVKSNDFSGYPFIIVHPASFTVDERSSLDLKSKTVFWDIEVEIIASDRGYGSADGKGQSNLDAISNDVMETLLNATNRTTLSQNGMFFSSPQTTSVVSEIIDNERVYRRSIMCSFKSRMQVSA